MSAKVDLRPQTLLNFEIAQDLKGAAGNTAAVRRHGIRLALACRTFGLSETCYRYSPKLDNENERIGDLLSGLTKVHRTWGFGLCFLHLRNVKGHRWNHKRVYRIYRELELNLRIKPRRRLVREKPAELAVCPAPLKLNHYRGANGGIWDGSKAAFG